MKNAQLNNYLSIPVCDAHLHLTYQDSLEKTINVYTNIMEHYGYERIVLQCMLNGFDGGDPANNAKALYVKSIMNDSNPSRKVYANGTLQHYYDGRDTAEGYLRQVQLMDALGFDGIKMLDGKPDSRKKLGRRLDDPIFDKFYAYAEEHDMPFTYHVGDPAENWDRSKITKEALERGWFYDESFTSLEQLREEIEGILTKFPKLRISLAHFYFMGDDLEGTIRLFEKYPNVSFDLCPGGEMFVGFSKRPEEWRQFFKKYADRIYFGTDTYNRPYFDNLEDYEKCMTAGYRINLTRRMLEWDTPFEDRFRGTLTPLNLDSDTLQKIYYDNCVARLGEPRKVDGKLAAAYASSVLEKFEHGFVTTGDEAKDKVEMMNLHQIYNYYFSE